MAGYVGIYGVTSVTDTKVYFLAQMFRTTNYKMWLKRAKKNK